MQSISTIGLDIAKSVFQVHGVRAHHLFIRQQTAAVNSIRAYLAEFGIVAPVGRRVSSNCWKSSPIQPTIGSPR